MTKLSPYARDPAYRNTGFVISGCQASCLVIASSECQLYEAPKVYGLLAAEILDGRASTIGIRSAEWANPMEVSLLASYVKNPSVSAVS